MTKMRRSETTWMMLCQRFLTEVTVEPVLFLYMLAIFSQYALFQDLVYTKVCMGKYSADICAHLNETKNAEIQTDVQTTSSHWILLSTITLVIPSILVAIYLGSWSDRFGRKWPVVIPPFGGALGCLVFIVISFKADAPVDWILLASSISGLSGGFVSCIMSCMSYVSSVSSSENRTMRISRLEAMTFLGGTIGPFLSGSMLEVTGHGWAFCFMAASYAVACLYAIFFVDDIKDASVDEGGKSHVCDKLLTQPLSSKRTSRSNRSNSGSSASKFRSNSNGDTEAYAEAETETDSTGSAEFDDAPVSGVLFNHDADVDIEKISIKGRSSSLAHHEDPLTSTDDEESRNIISRVSSSSPDHERIHSGKESYCGRYFNPKHLFEAITTVVKQREGNRRIMIILVLLAAGVSMINTAGEMDVAYLFAKDQPLNWSYQTYSYYFGMKFGLGALMLLLGMPLCQKWHLEDSTICIFGIVSRIASLILYGFSMTTWMAFCAPILGMFSFFTLPAMRALLSKLVAPSEQGKMFSFVAIMEDICTLAASTLFNSVYPITRNLYRGFIFFMAAGLLVIPLIIIGCARNKLSKLTPLPAYAVEAPSSPESPDSDKITGETPLPEGLSKISAVSLDDNVNVKGSHL